MLLSKLNLHNTRSYHIRSFSFHPHTTLILGPNASGKTNIIEAIYMMAVGKSFRAKHDREVIKLGSEWGKISCQTTEEKLELILTAGSVNGKKTPLKKYLVNGISRRQMDFVGRVKAVLFWPEHLDLVIDRPSVRRDYLDSVLVQIDREYRRTLRSYQKGVRQRNRVLDAIAEGHANRSQLTFWNQLLIKAGGYITDKRMAFIDYINQYDVEGLSYRLEYDKSVISESRLEQYKDAEVGARVTLVGPHRDDFQIFVTRDTKYVTRKEKKESQQEANVSPVTSHMSLSSYGSRGQQRLAVLWMKLAELSYITEQSGDKPVLLLDDIFSELDSEHQHLVFALIRNQQTIITSADIDIADIIAGVGIADYSTIALSENT